MTTPTAGSDTVLAGRYRLLRVRALDSETGSGDLWRARDEVLARPVAVRAVPSDDPRAAALLEAASRAGRLSDSRLARVLDAAEEDGLAFVVVEWVDGESMASTLRALGPFDPARAAAIVLDMARVVAAAHTQGLAHLRVHPQNVVITAAGEPKLTDLEVAAALAGTDDPADPRRVDAHGLGMLLYAALTARWPEGPAYGLPGAPRHLGHPVAVRQLRAGIPRDVDAIVERCLSDGADGGPRRAVEPLRTPSAVVAALAGLPRAQPDAGFDGDEPLLSARARRLLRVAVPLLVIAAVVVTGWLSGLTLGRVPGPGRGFATSTTTPPSPGATTSAALTIHSVRDFDPEGDGRENPDETQLAHDGDASTAWETGLYARRPDFGGLKQGVGLLLDLGSPQRVTSVTVLLTAPGATLELRAADTPAREAAGYSVVATASNAGAHPPAGAPTGTVSLTPTGGAFSARYWLLWLTRLPPDGTGFRVGVAEVTFHG
ncbi:MAG: protein kinase family protein [Actinomycetes bacterium]